MESRLSGQADEEGATKFRMVTAVVDKAAMGAAASVGSIGVMAVVAGGYPVGKATERVMSGRVL